MSARRYEATEAMYRLAVSILRFDVETAKRETEDQAAHLRSLGWRVGTQPDRELVRLIDEAQANIRRWQDTAAARATPAGGTEP